MRKPGAHGQAVLAEYEERRMAALRAESIRRYGRLGKDEEPVIHCSRAECLEPATWWLCREDGVEALRCRSHGLAAVSTDRREINPYDWRSLPDDPFEKTK